MFSLKLRLFDKAFVTAGMVTHLRIILCLENISYVFSKITPVACNKAKFLDCPAK